MAQQAVADPTESKWGLAEGDEIVPGRTALRLLGGGYRYEAYLAWDDHLRAFVVLKLVRPGLVDDRSTLRGLAGEAETLAALNHPVVVRAFELELDGPRPHLVLEHIEGPRLSTLLRKHGPLPAEQLVPLAAQVCSALHYMAAEGFVHLDVKPSNIIMSGPPRLIDLSIARPAADCDLLDSAVGTDAYMAPEQCQPGRGHPVGPASDVWGIGATLYRALVGERPFETVRDAEDPEVRWPQLHQPAPSLAGREPASVCEVVEDCLRFDPADRPHPGEVAERLEQVLEDLPRPRISKLKPRLGGR